MSSIDSDEDLAEYLKFAAKAAGVSEATLLRQVLHVNPLTQEPGFQRLFSAMHGDTVSLLIRLDRRLRILNPGLHYVFRTTYLGYRRESGSYATAASERAQVFVSIVPRTARLRVMLPVDPTHYQHLPHCRNLAGQGHHGVGDLQVDVLDEEALDRFFKTFQGWLARPGAIPRRRIRLDDPEP